MGFHDGIPPVEDPADSEPPVDEELDEDAVQSEAGAELQRENAETSLDQPSQ
jgi:hypothetical protein